MIVKHNVIMNCIGEHMVDQIVLGHSMTKMIVEHNAIMICIGKHIVDLIVLGHSTSN